MDFTQPQIMANTWNFHGGRTTNQNIMQKIHEVGDENKRTIRDLFLDGKNKKTWVVQGNTYNQAINQDGVYDEIRKFAIKKYDETRSYVWRTVIHGCSNIFVDAIINNESIQTVLAESFSEKEKMNNLIYFITRCIYKEDILKTRIATQRKHIQQLIQSTSPISPKLSKQIVQLQKTLNAGSATVFSEQLKNEILSIFSVIQSFQFKPVDNWKITLSVDPIDFLTASLNSYNWSTCNAPDKSYSAMPLALYQDAYTVVVYIESEKSRFVAFEYEENNTKYEHICSDKKMRRYVYFNEDYSGALISRTYPNNNPGLDGVILDIFKTFGMENNILTEAQGDDFDENRFSSSSAVFEEIDLECNFLVGDIESRWSIGKNTPCLSCGAENVSSLFRVGLCSNCLESLSEPK